MPVRRDQRPAQRPEALDGRRRAPRRGRGRSRGRGRGSRPRAARAACRTCAAGRSRRARRPARGSRARAPPCAPGSGARTRRHHGAVGDAEQRELVDAERDAQVLEVPRGLGRVEERALVAELGRAGGDVGCAVERALGRARVAGAALVDGHEVVARRAAARSAPRIGVGERDRRLAGAAAEQDERARPRAGRGELRVGERERARRWRRCGRAGRSRARTARPSGTRRTRRTARAAKAARTAIRTARNDRPTGIRAPGRGRDWSMSPTRHTSCMPALDELGWLQFERLCELVLEADAGVDPRGGRAPRTARGGSSGRTR